MRNKVILIKGHSNIASRITLAAYERIFVDHIVLITALKYPQCLPARKEFDANIYANETDEIDPLALLRNVENVLNYWYVNDCEHLVTSEYASIAIRHNIQDVKVVEGEALRIDWFYKLVKALHRNCAVKVIDAEIVSETATKTIMVDGLNLSIESAIERFKPHPQLG